MTNYKNKMKLIDIQFQMFLGNDYLQKHTRYSLMKMLQNQQITLLNDSINAIYNSDRQYKWKLWDYSDRFYRAMNTIIALNKKEVL